MIESPSVPGGEFDVVLNRLGSHVAGRYHSCSESIENDYEVCDTVLGDGGNGKVLLARSRSDSTESFAVKTVHFSSIAGINEWNMLEKQLEVALLVDHPQLIGVVDVYETVDALHFVMPCMEGGQLIKEEGAPPMSDPNTRDVARQMTLALSYLHSQGIVHRDVKPANFVLQQESGGRAKMIDFDLSTFWKPGDAKMSTCCGTPGYMSPELLTGQGYSSQTDLWSLGVTLFTLLVGELPFSSKETPTQELVDELFASKVMLGLSSDAVHLLASLLRIDPNERPSAEETLRHPFVAVRKQKHTNTANAVASASTRRTRSGRCNQLGRRSRLPQRRRTVGIGRARNTYCSGQHADFRTYAEAQLSKLLQAFDEEQRAARIQAAPLKQNSAKVRWADLDLEDDEEQPIARSRYRQPTPNNARVCWADLEDDEDEVAC